MQTLFFIRKSTFETIWLEEEQSLEDEDFVILRSKMSRKEPNTTTPVMDNGIGDRQAELLLQVSPKAGRATSLREPPRLRFHDLNETTSRSASINVISIDDHFQHQSGSIPRDVDDMHGLNVISIDDEYENNSTTTQKGLNDDITFIQCGPEDAGCANQTIIPPPGREVELNTFPEASVEFSAPPVQETPKIRHMTSEEILHKYWKMSCRLRASSCVFQRWLASLIALVVIWCVIYLLHWQYEPANMSDVIQFVIPLLLLPLLCSAFAEVNLEGVRLVKCIFPIDERLPLLRFLQMNPLQMTVFNVNLSYSTILTVVFAIFVAFTSRLIFTELQRTN